MQCVTAACKKEGARHSNLLLGSLLTFMQGVLDYSPLNLIILENAQI